MANTHPTPDATYTVVARRYRPQQFADLIGQEHVAQGLSNAIISGRIAHAFLFTGARGTGKTSTARILAKALNCVKGPTATPCDVCEICLSIANGDDTDVLEIDGASNNKVEEIRDLKSNVGFRPQRSRYKIYIIDEVHMLSNSAFNALLKTLEEPPPHVKFIFATTESQKIPITILSRCQRFDFAAIGPTKIFHTLRHIVRKEGLEADDDALHIISRRAAGSMRDGQTMLDQLLGYCVGTLTAEKLHTMLGTAGDEWVDNLATAILARDTKQAIELISKAADRGVQLGELLDQLVDYWRGLMVILVAGADAQDLPGIPSQHQKIREAASRTNLDTVLAGLDVLTTTKGKLRGSQHIQVLIEVAVVRLSRLEEMLSVTSLVQMLTNGAIPAQISAKAVAKDNSRVVQTTAPAIAAAVTDSSKKNDLTKPVVVATSSHDKTTGDITAANLPAIWSHVVQDVGMVRGKHLETSGLPAIIGPNTLAIRFPTTYSAAYDSCATDASQEVFRRVLKKVTGKDCQVRVERTNEQAVGLPLTANVAPNPPDRKKDLLQLPLFQKAMSTLGAQLMRVDDGFNPFSVPQPLTPAVVIDDGSETPMDGLPDPDEV